MDSAVKDLDFSIRHWAPYPRQYPATFRLATVGALPRKAARVDRAFASCNFSFILRGRGEYRRLGRTWAVQGPCVITQWPDEHVVYGPPEGETWDEVFLIYDAKLFGLFQERRLVDLERPVWPIRDLARVEAQLAELAALCSSRSPEQAADRVDRVCERLVLESWLAPAEPASDPDGAAMIHQVIRRIREHLDHDIDFDDVAAEYGMSPATFRRRWAEVMATPPGRYRLELRLREACRLLTETTRPIFEIARAVGFDDEMYFSRRFHQELAVAPRVYRRMYQMQRGEGSRLTHTIDRKSDAP